SPTRVRTESSSGGTRACSRPSNPCTFKQRRCRINCDILHGPATRRAERICRRRTRWRRQRAGKEETQAIEHEWLPPSFIPTYYGKAVKPDQLPVISPEFPCNS